VPGTEEDPIWVGEQDVAQLLSLQDAIDVLADAYRLQAAGAAASMRRSHLRVGEEILHAVGGTIAGARLAGTKTWTYTPGGAAPLLILFSLDDGRVVAIVEAFAMGQMRTAATSGLGTRVLARPDSRSLALLGTGKQAFAQAHAVSCVRPIDEVRLFGRDPERRSALADRLRDALAVRVSEHDDVATAVDGADVVTAVTRSAEPLLSGAMLTAGTHVNAVGAIVPTRRELDPTAVGRCAAIVADSLEQAREDAGELRAAVAERLLDWSGVRGLADVVDQPTARLRAPADITLFKALGVGLSDVALGAEIVRRAHAADAGHPLPRPLLHHH
jgi:alanine dehydrogenase